jgi:glutamine---fructose-6-phosphate transaminase (isomerizing)
MCGIVAYVGPKDAAPILLEGLARLEYRGYDSAGMAVLSSGGLKVEKAAGKVRTLAERVPRRFRGSPGIGHTRWATHGVPNDVNSHPHLDAAERVAIVHNGIIENFSELRDELIADGVEFRSDTDSEVLAHLIARSRVESLEEAVGEALGQVTGTYGLAVISADYPDQLVVARNGSPVVIGIGDGEMYAASDVVALVRHTSQVVHLEDGEIAVLSAGSYSTFDLDAERSGSALEASDPAADRRITVDTQLEHYDKGGHHHYMHKEIHDQPKAVQRSLSGRIDRRFQTTHLGGLGMEPRELSTIARVKVLGCGSAYFSGLVGAQLIESLARIPADAEPASEYRYRNPVVEQDTLYVAVSQSGETFDTLAAVRELKRKGARVIGLVNVVGSTIARECGGGMYLHSGPEVSVASTKTFTSTAVAFALLSIYLGRMRDMGPADGARLLGGLEALPGQIDEVLASEDDVAQAAQRYASSASMLFVGRVAGYPIACEGAQKLKEIAYIHAEAYPTSELKHGPLALVGPEMPTVMVLPDDHLREKNLSSAAEIFARQGPVITVGPGRAEDGVSDHLTVPRNEPELDPILLGIPLQLFAYHAAVALGVDVDQPRNLAKSVTVE